MNRFAPIATRLSVAASFLLLTLVATGCSRFSDSGSLSLWGIILLVLDVLALIDVFRQPWTTGKKILWLAIIWFMPFLGLILYYLISGRGKSNL
ncbi:MULTISPECIES: PLD nuclease N-terminal domain-containing protein [Hymenobacter]|uniref:PLDc_N domain-containing protein n=1 Tax=Hymenobacter jejuensis TaxID=2502781 RepID=A0A5B7ZY18_9BACT|nr:MULTISPECIES: PLD nuclease N-terminal domain-containing protein [Hymenobacter]MBC6991753.1 PLDc_N domain-containing protein [Hymenobacter sp. BT491]QDA60074.1 PLDc_N domain-containing protein [Hymenobacter jejuensis]